MLGIRCWRVCWAPRRIELGAPTNARCRPIPRGSCAECWCQRKACMPVSVFSHSLPITFAMLMHVHCQQRASSPTYVFSSRTPIRINQRCTRLASSWPPYGR